MISSDSYYNLEQNRITVRGFSYSDNAEGIRLLQFPNVLPNIYGITTDGRIYSFMNDSYIAWSIRDKLPYVTLSCMSDRGIHLEPIYIKDLVAYNFIVDAVSYLERGCRVVNVDGDPMNCNYMNIRYLDPSMEL